MYTLLLLLLSQFSCVRHCATPETAAHQAPLSLGFSGRQQKRIQFLPSRRSVQSGSNPEALVTSRKVCIYVKESAVAVMF